MKGRPRPHLGAEEGEERLVEGGDPTGGVRGRGQQLEARGGAGARGEKAGHHRRTVRGAHVHKEVHTRRALSGAALGGGVRGLDGVLLGKHAREGLGRVHNNEPLQPGSDCELTSWGAG